MEKWKGEGAGKVQGEKSKIREDDLQGEELTVRNNFLTWSSQLLAA